jgi:hypothetical protein
MNVTMWYKNRIVTRTGAPTCCQHREVSPRPERGQLTGCNSKEWIQLQSKMQLRPLHPYTRGPCQATEEDLCPVVTYQLLCSVLNLSVGLQCMCAVMMHAVVFVTIAGLE